jgi:predicted HD phosphohydrolase
MYLDIDFFKPLLDILQRCQGVHQEEKYHPEKDVLEHCLQTFNCAYKETDDIDLILAALFHDVGKIVENNGHEDYSVDMLCNYLTPKAIWLIKNHMRIRLYLKGTMKKHSKVKELVEHPWFIELIQLSRFDKMGRNPNKQTKFDRNILIEKINNKIKERFKNNKLKGE